MPTKKALAALLSETPQQPLRRGRGLRLSRASKQARELASKPSVSPEPSTLPEPSATVALPSVELAAASAPAAPPIAPDAVAVEAGAAAAPIESAAFSDPEPLEPARDKRKLQLRKDLLKQCKRIARAQDRKLYQVIESALEEYIQRHGAHE
jgi:hypothetical protein